ncbi:hypothetical protein ACFW1A_04825 [Kitasatospora sp. NPDC058965]|uniref:hypothetical protein n=1 Tax=Kitasatospora sp. NPDC058965 TaxID=3346682 RepID=UPI0036AE37B7
MSDSDPWTIERISDALGSPGIRQVFLAQINKAPLYELANIAAKWQGIAERTLATAERIREAHTAEQAGRPVPGDWVDASDRLPHHRGAA